MAAKSREASARPSFAGRDQGSLDAEVLLAHVLEHPRSWLYAHPEHPVDDKATAPFLALVRRRAAGEPLEYITGHADFFGLRLEVTADVLVPRPETETLVETALSELKGRTGWVADVGTGSGAIALAIAGQHPGVTVVATDVSLPALRMAARNVQAHHLDERVQLVNCHLLSATSVTFGLVVANLPYVAAADLEGPAAPVVRHEPRLALDGGADGLDLIRSLLTDVPRHLARLGTALLEIGAMQGDQVRDLATRLLPGAEVSILPDLTGRDRILRVRLGN